MSLPAYPEYEDSNSDWLGRVPAHWKILPLKRLLDANDGGVWGDDPDGGGDTIVLRSTDQTADGKWQINDPAPRKLSATEKDKAMLHMGDLLVTKSSGSSLHIGKTTLVDEEVADLRACYSNFMQRLTPSSSLSSRLAWYFLNSLVARKQLDVLSNSAISLANLNGTILGLLETCQPPENEQIAIAAFLDHETGKIDDLIAEQERLIALLDEKRQAVISHAVTKGLHPDVEMKDSGIEWLGEVPAHWGVMRIREAAALINGYPFNSDKFSQETGYPLVRIRDLGCKSTAMLYDGEFVNAAKIDGNDILIGMDGDFNVGRWKGEGHALLNQRVCCLRGQSNVIRWLEYILPYPLKLINDVTYSTTVKHLSSGQVLDIRIPMPSESERNELLNYLDENVGLLSSLSETAEAGISLLKERRSALISAAVTGKIDVRNHPAAVAALNENKDN